MPKVIKASISLKEFVVISIFVIFVAGFVYYDSGPDPIFVIFCALLALGGCVGWLIAHPDLCTRCGSRVSSAHTFCGKCARIRRRVQKLEKREMIRQREIEEQNQPV